ncbi:MAG: O-antigen ligase family protein [Chloroflexaceae bacterium]
MLPRRTDARLLFLLLVDLLLLVALAAVIWFDNAVNRGITYTPDPTPIPWANEVQVGVNAYNLHLEPDPAVVTRTLQLAHDLGVRYVRMQIPWEDIEIHGRGDFTDRRNVDSIGEVSAWAKYDRIVALAHELDLELVMRVDRAPMWAGEFFKNLPAFQEGLQIDPTSTGPPDDFVDFQNFMYTLAERYRGKVRFFQIWNEPNLLNEWNWQTPNPRDFVTLQCLGYYAVNDANPEAVVLFPSLAPTDGLDKRAPLTDLEFLDQFYRDGGGDCFDIMSAQAYGLGQPPDEHRYVRLRTPGDWVWSRPIDTRVDVSRVVLLREVMERHGDADKAIWIGEFGWNSAPETIPPERRFTWGPPVSEEVKAQYIIDQVERAKREWPWMGVMHIWMLRQGGYLEPDPNDPTPYFALVTRDWTRLPAYTRLQEYLNQPTVAGVGAHTWEHPAVTAIPDGWQLRFTGSRVTLIGGLNPGPEEVTLNGRPVTLAAQRTATGEPALQLAGLPDTTHTLAIRAPGEAPPERFVIGRDQPLPGFWVAAPALLIGLLLLSGVATMQAFFGVADAALARSAPGRMGLRPWLNTPAGERMLLLGMLLGVALFYRASTELPITLVGLALFGGLALLRPDLALPAVPLTVPLFFMPKGIWDARFGIRPEGLSFPLHEILLLVVVGATFVNTLAGWRVGGLAGWRVGTFHVSRLTPHLRENAPILLFLLAGTLGLLVAWPEGRGAALREWRWLIVEPLLFYGLLRCYLRRPRRVLGMEYRQVLVGAFVLGGALVGFLGILQFLGINLVPLLGTKAGFSTDSVLAEGVRRVTSVYGHPNNLGLFLGRVWPIAAALALAQNREPRTENRRRWLPGLSGGTLFFAVCALFSLGGLLVSFSKGALLGAVGALLLLVVWLGADLPWRFWRRYRVPLTLGLIAGGLGLLVLLLGFERLNPLGATSSIRLKTWASALAMLRDHPLVGVGLDQFGRLYPDYIHPTLLDTNEINTSHPHNIVLNIWLRMGLPGLVAFGWLLVRFWTQRSLQHSTLNTQHSALDTQHSALDTQHSALSTQHSTLSTQHSTLSTHHSSLSTEHSTLSTEHSTLNTQNYLLAGVAAAMLAALLHGLVDNFYFVPDLAFAFWLLLVLGKR